MKDDEALMDAFLQNLGGLMQSPIERISNQVPLPPTGHDNVGLHDTPVSQEDEQPPQNLDAPISSVSPSPNAIVPTRFPRFKDLPTEIRIMIWKAALPPGRVVEIRVRKLKQKRGEWDLEVSTKVPTHFSIRSNSSKGLPFWGAPADNLSDDTLYGFESMCRPPAILFACKQSNEVASVFFKQVFRTPHAKPTIYFDFENDTLLIQPDKFYRKTKLWGVGSRDWIDPIFELFGDVDFGKVRNLALVFNKESTSAFDFGIYCRENYPAAVLRRFQGVKKLTFCIRHYSAETPRPNSTYTRWDRYMDMSDVTLMEPIDLGSCCSAYFSDTIPKLTPQSRLLGLIPPPANFTNLGNGLISRSFDLEKFREILAAMQRVTVDKVVLPEIHWKISVSQEARESVDAFMQGLDEDSKVVPTVKPGDYDFAAIGTREALFERLSWSEFIDLYCKRLVQMKEEVEERKRSLLVQI